MITDIYWAEALKRRSLPLKGELANRMNCRYTNHVSWPSAIRKELLHQDYTEWFKSMGAYYDAEYFKIRTPLRPDGKTKFYTRMKQFIELAGDKAHRKIYSIKIPRTREGKQIFIKKPANFVRLLEWEIYYVSYGSVTGEELPIVDFNAAVRNRLIKISENFENHLRNSIIRMRTFNGTYYASTTE